MNDEPALLAAIIAAPEDDTLRLAYADWLQEHDQPERAEFTRVQVELGEIDRRFDHVLRRHGRPEDDARSWVLIRREQELLESHGWQQWQGECRNLIPKGSHIPSRIKFRRGFIEAVTCRWEDWKQHGDSVRLTTPLKAVTLTNWPDTYECETPLNRIVGQRQRLLPRTQFWTIRECQDVATNEDFPRSVFPGLLSLTWVGIKFDLPKTVFARAPGQEPFELDNEGWYLEIVNGHSDELVRGGRFREPRPLIEMFLNWAGQPIFLIPGPELVGATLHNVVATDHTGRRCRAPGRIESVWQDAPSGPRPGDFHIRAVVTGEPQLIE